jgi:hypothetical protein
VVLYLVAAEKPLDRVDVRLAASLVDLGVVLYAMVAVSAETGVRAVFWALDQRRQWRAKMRAEMKEEVKAEVAAAVKAEVAAAVKADVVAAMKAEVRAVVDAGGDLKEWLDHDGGTLEEEHPKK